MPSRTTGKQFTNVDNYQAMDRTNMLHLQGKINLQELFGSIVYSPRPSFGPNRWLPDNAAIHNADSGRELPLALNTPVLCSRGASTPEGLQLLAAAGFTIPENLFRFSTQQECTELLAKHTNTGKRTVVNHPLSASELNPECYWIPRDFLQAINNKKNLDRLGPTEFIPHRKVMSMDELKELINYMEGAAVFKAATDESSCQGLASIIARESSELSEVLEKLDGAKEVIVEEYLGLPSTFSINFTLSHDGSITYLGAAERAFDDSGNHKGYWLETDPQLPPAAMNIGVMIATHCIEIGYYGFLNIDIGVLDNDEIRIFDLNFRATSATTALNFKDSILKSTSASTMLLARLTGKSDYQQLIKAGHDLLNQDIFLPLWSYNPLADGIDNFAPQIGGLILGNSRGEVYERKKVTIQQHSI